MKKRLVLILMLIGLLAFGAGLGTYAWFTSSATSENNVFETGTLEIGGIGNSEFTTNLNNGNNIYPGWEAGKKITVTNTGSLDLMYRIKDIEYVSGSKILFDGKYKEDNNNRQDWNYLQVSFGDDENWYYINQLKNYYIGKIYTDNRDGNFYIKFRLPEKADNKYQGKNVTLKFNLEATQIGNTSWQIPKN